MNFVSQSLLPKAWRHFVCNDAYRRPSVKVSLDFALLESINQLTVLVQQLIIITKTRNRNCVILIFKVEFVTTVYKIIVLSTTTSTHHCVCSILFFWVGAVDVSI